MVAGIEDAAKFVVTPEERVRFVDEEGRLHFFDDAEEGRRADVGGDDGAVDEFAQDTEQRGFAAAFHRRFDAEVGGDVAELEAVGVNDPEGQCFGRVFGEDDEAGKEFAELIQDQAGLARRGWRIVNGGWQGPFPQRPIIGC